MKKSLVLVVLLALALAPAAFAAAVTATGTNNVAVTVGAEASITIGSATTLASVGTAFANYTGTTNFTYKIRTTKVGGSGNVALQVTTDFGAGGATGTPSVLTPPTTGDLLTYMCTATGTSSPTACTGPITASTTATTAVLSVVTDAHSALAGDSGSVSWTLVNDPMYKTGLYTAVVTFTVTAV
jgi:streptogramin lyase